MSTEGYRDLKVWQKGIDFVQEVYRISSSFPDDERFGLTAQIRRAAVSVPSNIAEGRGRGSDKEFIRFIHIALGSLAEVDTQLEVAVRLHFIREQETQQARTTLVEIRRMLFALKNSLKS